MVKYKVGDKVRFKTNISDAYAFGLIPENKLTPGLTNYFSYPIWDEKCFEDLTIRDAIKLPLMINYRVYGKVVSIREGKYANNIPFREINCVFSNGTELGCMETDKQLKKANILERLVLSFNLPKKLVLNAA